MPERTQQVESNLGRRVGGVRETEGVGVADSFNYDVGPAGLGQGLDCGDGRKREGCCAVTLGHLQTGGVGVDCINVLGAEDAGDGYREETDLGLVRFWREGTGPQPMTTTVSVSSCSGVKSLRALVAA
jgi:hypothetical protein